MEHLLDVSMLEPCEPMQLSLAACHRLAAGDYLRILHRREPHLLYPMLEKLELSWHCRILGPSSFEIFVWRRNDLAAAGDVQRELTERC